MTQGDDSDLHLCCREFQGRYIRQSTSVCPCFTEDVPIYKKFKNAQHTRVFLSAYGTVAVYVMEANKSFLNKKQSIYY